MLRDLLGFELKLHTRQVAFWVTIVILVLVGLGASSADWLTVGAEGGQKIKINGTFVIFQFIGTISAISVFFGAVFTVSGLMRDDIHKSLEVIHATPVKTPQMIISRMIAVWLVTVACCFAGIIGYAAGQFMPWAPEGAFGPFNAWHYLYPSVTLMAVNALFLIAIFTAIAVTTRNRAIVYVSAIGVLIASIAIDGLLTAQAPEWARGLLEPFGSGAYILETEFWSAAERNTEQVGLMTWYGGNRLIIILLSLAIFGFAFWKSRRGILPGKRKRKNDNASLPPPPRRISPVTPKLGFSHFAISTLRRTRFEFLSTIRTTAMIILLSIAAFIFVINVIFGDSFEADPTLKTTSYMVQLALGSFGLSMIIVMIFFGSDIVWRDRLSNMHRIVDATPVNNLSLLLAKWGALALLLLSMILVGLIFGVVAQIIVGDTTPVPRTYLAVGLLSFFVSFFFQGMLVMFIQNFMPGRVIGMFVAAGVLIGMGFISQLPFYHPLMNFGPGGPGTYSEMAGYQGFTGWKFRMAYWGAFIVLLAAMSLWLWRRGTEDGVLSRIKAVPKRISLPNGAVAGLSLAVFVALAFVGAGSYADRDYINSDARELRTAEFEKLVKDIHDRPTPRVTAASVDVDLFPSERRGVFSGTITFDNPHEEPIERVFVTTSVDKEDADVTISGATRVSGEKLADRLWDEYDVADFQFDPPLAPGETRSMTFTTRFNPPTITSGSSVRSNGTFINNSVALPIFGNLNRGFHTNPDIRKKHDLGERENWPSREDEEARRYQLLSTFAGYNDYVDFDARICTDPDQVPVTPGRFIRSFEKDGQHCREYRAINPIHYFFAFVSARYEVETQTWTGANGQTVDLEIYYHPEHDYNVDLMFSAMNEAFDTYTERFSDYQYAQLRIMEFPYASFAQAFAGTVPFSENIGFVRDPNNAEDPEKIDLATYITMHEIGHMWFAHQLVGAFAQGSNLLSEGLTEYISMIGYEEAHGYEKARRMHEIRMTRGYLAGRTGDPDDEPVLAKAENQGYLNYQKTSWVMWGLRGIVGDAPIERAVKRFLLEHHATKGAPYPTTLELIEILKEEVDPKYHLLIDDYWNRITFWELEIVEEPVVTKRADGRFDVAIEIKLDKNYASEEDGEETSVSELDDARLDEWVTVGLYTEDPKDNLGSSPIHQETVRVTEAEGTITITVKERPGHVILDPHRYLIERNVNDNAREVAKAEIASEDS